jgi:anthranilate synthase component 1
MAIPSWQEFERLSRQGNLIPIYEEVHFDWETPISAFRKIDAGKFSFLLESVEGGEKWGRYSFLGSQPSYLFRSKADAYEILRHGTVIQRGREPDPLRALQAFLASFQPVVQEGLPRFFGGAVGYVNYDVVRSFERLPEKLPDDLGLYDCYFMMTDTLLVFDNLKQKIKIIANAWIDGRRSPQEVYEESRGKIGAIIAQLKKPLPPLPSVRVPFPSHLQSNFERQGFMEAVRKAKQYIAAGDIIQVVLSQRFSTALPLDPFQVYRSLRSINPSPHLFYLRMDDLVLLGASPEVLVRLEGDRIELRPLAGTRRRGKTPAEDMELEKDLLADEKEKAEHIMLVDLGRNDVGRVAQIGSVEVTELMGIERYSHVMHIVSHIRGRLAAGKNAFDVFRAAFPAGTVSGAPKIRAMEIIEELEPVRRGPYAGAVGYFSFSGNMETCITIRSILVKQGMAYIQVGAGIVADSVPAREYEETMNKAQAIFRAIQEAKEGIP